MSKHALSLPLAGFMLAGLTACTESPTESAANPAPSAIAAATAANMTWYVYCDGCIMPSMEHISGTQLGGWTYSYKHPNSADLPVFRRGNPGAGMDGPAVAKPPGNLVDMDASRWDLSYLSDNGQIYTLRLRHSTWDKWPLGSLKLSTPPKGARRVGRGNGEHFAIVTNEVKVGGYGIQAPLGFGLGWKDIDGAAVDLDWDSNGDLWAVRSNGEVWSKAAWDITSSGPGPAWVYRGNPGGFHISAGGGKVAVTTNLRGGSGRFLKRYVGDTNWADLPGGQLDFFNIDGVGRIWGSNNYSRSYYAAMP